MGTEGIPLICMTKFWFTYPIQAFSCFWMGVGSRLNYPTPNSWLRLPEKTTNSRLWLPTPKPCQLWCPSNGKVCWNGIKWPHITFDLYICPRANLLTYMSVGNPQMGYIVADSTITLDILIVVCLNLCISNMSSKWPNCVDEDVKHK